MNKAYIVDGCRLPIGKANGIYKSVIPEVLAGYLMAFLIDRYPFLKSETDEIILGCALGTGGNMARYASIEAKFDLEIPAYTVDAQCASGLKAIIMAHQQIKAGANCIIAGGMESNSLAPKRQYQPNDKRFINENTFYTQASFAPSQNRFDGSLIIAAENVARKFDITKASMMQWTVKSQHNASNAINSGGLEKCIVPFLGHFHDQSLKANLSFERLQLAQSPHLIDHTNASHLHDGACAHMIVSDSYCNKHGHKPTFQIVSTATTAGLPNFAPMGVIWAVEMLLNNTGLNQEDIDLFEVNESFAVNALAFISHFQINPSKMNIFGGNLAFGHPFGASGAINLLHLIEAMKVTQAKRGIVTIAAAGGLGMAVMLEQIN